MPDRGTLTEQDSVRIEIELMPDGDWYATLHIGGLTKAGSGRRATPEEAFGWLVGDAKRAAGQEITRE